jgi:hypothetical protein
VHLSPTSYKHLATHIHQLVWQPSTMVPPPSILPLHPNLRNPELHLHAIAAVLRVIWIRRNKAKFEGRTLSLCETRSLFKTELVRVIAAKWKHLLLSTLNQTQFCMDQLKRRKAITQFKRTWLIPQFFSINSLTILLLYPLPPNKVTFALKRTKLKKKESNDRIQS